MQQRLLVLIVAYHAEGTLASTLDRIPASLLSSCECEVLVVDDASADRTFAVGMKYKRSQPSFRMTVLRNRYNQGYGGNQKVGYAYAIGEGFDAVALLHGDGQYAPEELPRLVEPVLRGRADAVFGSRMLKPLDAVRGGMPIYKWVGNRILTAYQNAVLGTALSEFHSGYRVYSVEALRSIPFRLNTNDFHFDTEIIIQLLNAGARMAEVPIPTYYGDEICRVNGLRYAWDVAIATTRNLFHRAGLLYQRRYDTEPPGNTRYDLKLGYASSHSWAVQAVPPGATVLDIGSGPGQLACEIARKGCQVTLVDRYPAKEVHAGVRVVLQDLDEPLQLDIRGYDYIVMLDILEHLRSPEQFLEQLRAQFDHTPRRVVVSLPNVAFIVVRLTLLLGQFNYGRTGILDRTHTHLFTFRSARHLLRDSGFVIRRMRGVPAPIPKVLGFGWLGRLGVALNLALIRLCAPLFSYQIFIEADSTPEVDFVLRDTREMSQEAAN